MYYEAIYKCGHKGTLRVTSQYQESESYFDWVRKNRLCKDCFRKQLQDSRKAAADDAIKVAKLENLPLLKGSEKQVPWAETIRANLLPKLKEATLALEKSIIDKKEEGSEELIQSCFTALNNVMSEKNASWWINNRQSKPKDLIVQLAQKCLESIEDETPEALEAMAEATIRPISPLTETVAEIKGSEDLIEVVFSENRKDFWEIIKLDMRFSWQGQSWKRTLTPENGPVAQRIAQTGAELLAAGFIVRIFDEQARDLAISGKYEPEHTNWIIPYGGRLAITWKGMDPDLYRAAKNLPGARYTKPLVVVAVEHYEDIYDFAEMYGFRFSEEATTLMINARKVKEASLVAVAPAKAKPIAKKRLLKLVLPKTIAPAPEFLDEAA